MRREVNFLLLEKIFEAFQEQTSDGICLRDPRALLIPDCINVIPFMPDNCGEVEELGIPITELKPKLFGFFMP